MPRGKPIDAEKIEIVRQYYRANPGISITKLAKKFKIAPATIRPYVGDNTDGDIEIIRAKRRKKSLVSRCGDCGIPITRGRGNATKCVSCLSKKFGESSFIFGKVKSGGHRGVKLETCESSPTQNHHYILDRSDGGRCKYCATFRDFRPYNNEDNIPKIQTPSQVE